MPMFDFLPHERNIIKNISCEVIRECSLRNINISLDVASLLVTLLSLDALTANILAPVINRESIEKTVNQALEQIIDANPAQLKILQMQAYYIKQTVDLEKISKQYNEEIEEKTAHIKEEILEAKSPRREELNQLFNKIVIYINMTYMLGNCSNPKIMSATANALKSVMARSDLNAFFGLSKNSRLEHLKTMQEVVAGIRIFNKDNGNCAEGVRDIQADIETAYKNTKNCLNERLSVISKRIELINRKLTTLYDVDYEKHELIFHLPNNFTEENFEQCKTLLTMNYQHEKYLKCLIMATSQMKINIDMALVKFRKSLDDLHDIMQYRTAIPTDKVFPHFSKIAVTWRTLLDIIYALVEINTINEELFKISETVRPFMDNIELLEDGPNEDNLPEEKCSLRSAIPKCRNIKFVEPTHNTMLVPMSKFCPYMYILGDGLLVPGKSRMGYMSVDEYMFSFSKYKYAKFFTSNIVYCLWSFIKTAKRRIETILLLDIYESVRLFPPMSPTPLRRADFEKEKEKPPPKRNIEVQTETHPIPHYVDKDYSWNIWDIRRKAIQLANLKNCLTHSTQTEISYYRTSTRLQTIEQKPKSVQTMKDASTMVKCGMIEEHIPTKGK